MGRLTPRNARSVATVRQGCRRLAVAAFVVAAMTGPWCDAGAAPAGDLFWPLDLKPALSSTFGETRATAFHAGIDLKTWGRTGYEVHAAGDGWVQRVRTSPWGYGRAVYVKLNDGRIAVYGHLESFAEPLAGRVLAVQRAVGHYSVQLWFEDGEIAVRRGQVIARTGQSGAGPPHLHFEIRDAANVPLNPLLNGAGPVADTRAPTLRHLLVTPLEPGATVDGGFGAVTVPLAPASGGDLVAAQTVRVWGGVGLAVDSYDRADLADNRLAPLEQALLVDGDTVFVSTYERVSYNDGHQVALDRLRPATGGVYAALFRRPGNRLSFYHGTGDGVLWAGGKASGWREGGSGQRGVALAPGEHRLTVAACDAAGNTTAAHVQLLVAAPPRIHTARLVHGAEGAWFVEADVDDADDERLEVEIAPVGLEPGAAGIQAPGAGRAEKTGPSRARGGETRGDATARARVSAGGGETEANATVRAVTVGGGPYTWRLPEASVAAWSLSVRDGVGQVESQTLTAPVEAVAPAPFELSLGIAAGTRDVVVTVVTPRPLRSTPTVSALGRTWDIRQTGPTTYAARVDLDGGAQESVEVEAVAIAADGGLGHGRLVLSGRALHPGRADTLGFLDGTAVLLTGSGSAYEPLYAQATGLVPEASAGLRATTVGCELGPADAAFDARARVALRVPADAAGARLGVYADDGEGRWVFLGADTVEVAGGGSPGRGAAADSGPYLSCEVRALGRFALLVDEIPPTIQLRSPVEGEIVRSLSEVVAHIVDAGSGITREEDIAVEVDGTPWIAEYDPEADLVRAQPVGPLATGEHRWVVRVRDSVGNEAEMSAGFRVR